MVNPLRLQGNVRDISIDLHDSCNCCCWSYKDPKPDTPVYITSKVVAIKFIKISRTSYYRSVKKSVYHINRHIESLSKSHRLDHDQAIEQISKIANVSLDEGNPPQLNLAMIKRINAAIKEVFS